MTEPPAPPTAAGPAAATDSRPRRIGLVEDHASVVLGVRAMLADTDDLRLVASAGTVEELLAQHEPLDLTLLDLRLGDGSAPKANVDLLHSAGSAVLIYTGGENPYLVRAAARAGVLGVIRKSEPVAVTIEAIRAAADGRQVATTDWAAAIDADPNLSDVGLSPRQREVLALYASGEKAGRVARLTGLSEQTVHDYLGRIRQKYAEAGRPAPTKTDLYKRAVEDGWLPVPEQPAP